MCIFIYISHALRVYDTLWKVLSLAVFILAIVLLYKTFDFSFCKSLLLSISFTYLFFVISATILSREPGVKQGIDYNLISDIDEIVSGNFSVQIEALKNFLMLFPLGMLTSFIKKEREECNFLVCTLFGLALSVFIETIQFVFRLGLSELLDVVCNTAGMSIGWVAGHTVMNICKTMRARK